MCQQIRRHFLISRVHHKLGGLDVKILCLLLSQTLALVSCQSSPLQNQPEMKVSQTPSPSAQREREWRPANFRGLIVGKSKRVDMLRVLGKPAGSTPFDDELSKVSGVLYEFKSDREIPGVIVVSVDKRSDVILNVELEPQGWTKEQAIKYFGEDYVITRYGFDDCLGDGESAPLYEAPDGPITKLEYRDRGIAIALNDEGKVDFIAFVSQPVGAPTSRCKQKG